MQIKSHMFIVVGGKITLTYCRCTVYFAIQIESQYLSQCLKKFMPQKSSICIIGLSGSHLEKAWVTYCVFQRFLEIDCQHQHQTQLVSNSCYYCPREITDPLSFDEGSPIHLQPKSIISSTCSFRSIEDFCQLKKGSLISNLKCNFVYWLQDEIPFFEGLEYGIKLVSCNGKIRGKY